jgi:hypothetical protein
MICMVNGTRSYATRTLRTDLRNAYSARDATRGLDTYATHISRSATATNLPLVDNQPSRATRRVSPVQDAYLTYRTRISRTGHPQNLIIVDLL